MINSMIVYQMASRARPDSLPHNAEARPVSSLPSEWAPVPATEDGFRLSRWRTGLL